MDNADLSIFSKTDNRSSCQGSDGFPEKEKIQNITPSIPLKSFVIGTISG